MTDVVTAKQNPRLDRSLWSDLRDLLVKMDAMERAAPQGMSAQLAQLGVQELAALQVRLVNLDHKVILETSARRARPARTEYPAR